MLGKIYLFDNKLNKTIKVTAIKNYMKKKIKRLEYK